MGVVPWPRYFSVRHWSYLCSTSVKKLPVEILLRAPTSRLWFIESSFLDWISDDDPSSNRWVMLNPTDSKLKFWFDLFVQLNSAGSFRSQMVSWDLSRSVLFREQKIFRGNAELPVHRLCPKGNPFLLTMIFLSETCREVCVLAASGYTTLFRKQRICDSLSWATSICFQNFAFLSIKQTWDLILFLGNLLDCAYNWNSIWINLGKCIAKILHSIILCHGSIRLLFSLWPKKKIG